MKAYTVVEKILEGKEELPESWDVEGTVGYDFLNEVNGLFIEQKNEQHFTKIYENFIGYSLDFEKLLYEKEKDLHKNIHGVKSML